MTEEIFNDNQGIPTAELLKRYAEADCFTLTAFYKKGVDREHPFGTVGITEEDAAHAVKVMEEWDFAVLKNCYGQLSEKEKAGNGIPSFENLYEEISAECKKFRLKNADKIEKQGGMAFFCDEFARGSCRYKNPLTLWHFYHNVDLLETWKYELNQLRKLPAPERLDGELDAFPELKGALIGTEVTFVWHCTAGPLSTVFKFKLNDTARAWLLTRADDYDMPAGLEDLALYRGEKILFSSCTHEEFHTDCEK